MLISSDTNVWLDFSFIGCLNHPFLLDNNYYLSSITYHDEIDDSVNYDKFADRNRYSEIRKCVKDKKILITDATIKELKLAMLYSSKYRSISKDDAIALAIAKERKWYLLTGDNNLREAAKKRKRYMPRNTLDI